MHLHVQSLLKSIRQPIMIIIIMIIIITLILIINFKGVPANGSCQVPTRCACTPVSWANMQ